MDKMAPPNNSSSCWCGSTCPLKLCISKNALSETAPRVWKRKIGAGGIVAPEHLPSAGLCVVASGAIKVCDVNLEGETFIRGFLFPGEFLELRPWKAPRSGDAIALTETHVCEVGYRWDNPLGPRRPDIDRVLLTVAIKQAQHGVAWQRTHVSKRPIERLTRFLIDIVDRTSGATGGYCLIDLPMGRSDIADYLGLRRETVSRCFSKLRESGFILMPSRHTVAIKDTGRLRAQIKDDEKEDAPPIHRENGGAITPYEIGHEKIDFEHQTLLGLIQSVAQQVENNSEEDKIRRAFDEIRKYAVFHFFSEETIMIDVGYSEIVAHKKLHRKLLGDLDRIINFPKNMKENIRFFLSFLFMWFTNHTTNEDSKIAKFINSSQRPVEKKV